MYSVEKNVRGSFEYRAMVNYLRSYMDMSACAIYENVNNVDSTKIKIEIHHEPLSLFDICLIVYNKRVAFHESLEEELVAKEVIYIHYQMQVGLIPLAETVHQLVHNQYIFVPTSRVYGKYKEFVDNYKPWMLPEQIDVLNKIEEASVLYDDSYKDVLGKHYIYVDMSGAMPLPTMNEMTALIKGRIGELMNDPQPQREQIQDNTANIPTSSSVFQ